MCRDQEVIEVAGARLAAAMSSWEYMLLRVQQEDEGNSSAPLIPRILNEATTLMTKVSLVASEYLHPMKNQADSHVFELKNPRTAQLIDLQCGTYYISKDDRRLLDDNFLLDDGIVDHNAIEPANSLEVIGRDDKVKSDTTSDLWEELEEATSHLPHAVTESSSSAAQDNVMMQVDEIVNQVVDATTQHAL